MASRPEVVVGCELFSRLQSRYYLPKEMNKKNPQEWVEAGINLSIDSNTKILCPDCHKAILKTCDIASPIDELKFERHVHCECCGAYNIILMNIPSRVKPEDGM
jgi:hypothetical protein